MKKITAYFENTEPIDILDSDNSNIEDYTKKLSEIFHSETVNILSTDHGCMIIKSNKLNSMVIENYSLDPQEDLPKQIDEETIVIQSEEIEEVKEENEITATLE